MYRLLVGKPEGKRALGRPSHRWVDNIKMDLAEMRLGCVDWIETRASAERRRATVNVGASRPNASLGLTN
jgi:hypothetical protein